MSGQTICGLNYEQTRTIIEKWFSIAVEMEDGTFRVEPFKLRGYQDRALREIFEHSDDNILIEKTRQIGMSWLFAAVYAAIALVGARSNLLVLGKNEKFIDDAEETVKPLMGRVKFILSHLRESQVALYAKMVIKSKYLMITNTASGTVINGSSAASDAGRGETQSVTWWDEAAFTNNDGKLFGSVAGMSKRLWMLSTANGKGNKFYDIRDKIEHKKIEGWHKIRLHWTEYFSEAWYEKAKQKLSNDPVLIAQELDINYEGSGSNRVFSNFPEKNFRLDAVFEGRLKSETVITFDFGIADWTACAVIQRHRGRGEYRIVDSFVLTNVPFELVLKYLTTPSANTLEEIRRRTTAEKYATFYRFAMNSVKWRYSDLQMTGDPAAKQRSLGEGTSIYDLFFDYGINFEVWIERTEDALSAIRGRSDKIYVFEELEEVKDCIRKWTYGTDSEGQPRKPRHDDWSHMGCAIKYGFTWLIREELGSVKVQDAV